MRVRNFEELFFFFSSRRRHTRWNCDWSSDVCSSDLVPAYWQWVRGARAGDDEGGGEVAPVPPEAPTPLTREYWAARPKHRIGEIVSSHTVKYPYSFYALAKDVKDEGLKKRILAKVYRLTATN